MISITICDDSKTEIEQLLVLLEDFSYKGTELSIKTFNSSVKLFESFESGNISDIYLLDIVMPGLSGIDIGTIIREKKDDVCIIFFTNSTEYALNAYKISALQYLIKPVEKNLLWDALIRAIQLNEKTDKTFIVDTPLGKVPIKYKDIIFIEYQNHVMNFHTKKSIVSSKYIRVSFNIALDKLLQNHCFIQPHRGYIVNMKHVKLISKRTFLMIKSYEIPISKSREEDSTKSYMKYILGETANV